MNKLDGLPTREHATDIWPCDFPIFNSKLHGRREVGEGGALAPPSLFKKKLN